VKTNRKTRMKTEELRFDRRQLWYVSTSAQRYFAVNSDDPTCLKIKKQMMVEIIKRSCEEPVTLRSRPATSI
jgi:hypothetical protein